MRKNILRLVFMLSILFLASCSLQSKDKIAPTIKLNGEATVYLVLGETYNEEGASCVDNVDTKCSVTIDSSNLDTTKVGSYTISYSAVDSSDNSSSLNRKVIVEAVADEVKPEITLNGSDTILIQVHDDYNELGATCTDNVDGTCDVSIDNSSVNTSIIGSYTVTYTSVDSSGNTNSANRTIIVQDTEKPVITLTGDSEITILYGSTYTELGATCSDNYDNACTVSTDNQAVDTTAIGSYTVTYTSVDSSGNTETATRTVIVEDSLPPVITLLGTDTVYVGISDIYIDLGAVCTDNFDDNCNVSVDDTSMDITTPGTYQIKYTSVDSLGNSSFITRDVVVQDKQNRTIRLSTSDVIYHIVNETYVEPSVYVPNNGNYSLYETGSVDETTIGTYPIEYKVNDELGNSYYLYLTVHVVSELPDKQDIVDLQNVYNRYPKIYNEIFMYDINKDMYLDTTEISTVHTLDLSGNGATNIGFLEYFTALTNLNVSNNDLYNFDFVANMPNLVTFNGNQNNFDSSDLCVLTATSIISELNLSGNYLQDLSCLNDVTTLTVLDLSDNSISNISSIDGLTGLTSLDISGNAISDFTPILQYTSLTWLNIEDTSITDVSGIENIEFLQYLTLDETYENYYFLDDLFHLKEVNILGYDADLENSFFFDYLESFSIVINTKSRTAFDISNPNLVIYNSVVTITAGSTYDWQDLNFLVYDTDDLYSIDTVTSDIADTSVLAPGEYTVTITVTDSDGNQASKTITLAVLNDVDLANLIVFIRFSDEEDFVAPYSYSYYNDFFNGNGPSLKDYYLEVSNNDFIIESVFPSTDIVFYNDIYERGYYQPYDAINNPIGYQDDNESYYREQELLSRAIKWLDQTGLISEDTKLDYDGDGEVDAVSFLVSGQIGSWSDLLWPHKYAMYESLDEHGDFYSDAPSINGDYVFTFTLQLIGDETEPSPYFDLGTFVHEMFHVIGAPDLYHYYSDDDIDPIGYWGLMSSVNNIPNHMLQYMKETYGNWDQDQEDITSSGTYVLNKTTDLENNLIIIDLGYSNEFLYMEYRQQTGVYESNLIDEGLLVYRVDKDYYDDGNIYGYYDENNIALEEVFVFRPIIYDNTIYTNESKYVLIDDGDPDQAIMRLDGNSQAGEGSNIPLFFSDGTIIPVTITIVSETPESVTINITIN